MWTFVFPEKSGAEENCKRPWQESNLQSLVHAAQPCPQARKTCGLGPKATVKSTALSIRPQGHIVLMCLLPSRNNVGVLGLLCPSLSESLCRPVRLANCFDAFWKPKTSLSDLQKPALLERLLFFCGFGRFPWRHQQAATASLMANFLLARTTVGSDGRQVRRSRAKATEGRTE